MEKRPTLQNIVQEVSTPIPQIQVCNIFNTPNAFFHPQKYITCKYCFKNFDGERRRARHKSHEKRCIETLEAHR